MASQRVSTYRAIVREVNRASIYPRATRPQAVSHHIRAVFEQIKDKDNAQLYQDLRNVATFMSAQRTHRTLLERYNPLHALSTEERVKATANRVGLDIPLGFKDEE